ncbi:MAG: recombinase family protein [Stellaceae bacterium]
MRPFCRPHGSTRGSKAHRLKAHDDPERAEALLVELISLLARDWRPRIIAPGGSGPPRGNNAGRDLRLLSSEHQHKRSIDDRARLCRDHAARPGAGIIGVYADYALSGSSLKNRPEAARLLADARVGRCGAVLSESLDRLSRDQRTSPGSTNG